MDEQNLPILSQAKLEYTNQLIDTLTPHIFDGIKSIYDEAITVNSVNRRQSITLLFRDFLENVPSWSNVLIEAETERIIKMSNCDWLDDLITAVFISHTKILTSIGTTSSNIDLVIPKITNFVHKCYINVAREMWKNPYLFTDYSIASEYQKNMRTVELIIKESIENTIRQLLPIKEILKNNLDKHETRNINEKSFESDDIRKFLHDEIKNLNLGNILRSQKSDLGDESSIGVNDEIDSEDDNEDDNEDYNEDDDEDDEDDDDDDDHEDGESEDDDDKNNKLSSGIEFKKVIKDLITDLLTTFPELSNDLNDDLKAIYEEKENEQVLTNLLNYTKNVYPERFFDILYKNVDIFKTYDINTKFLPGIEFSVLWNDDNISDKTRNVIWKYLQIILFIIIGDVNDKDLFGKSAEIFEDMDETELKDKLFDAVSNMHGIFDLSNANMDDVSGEGQLPNPEDIHNHLNSLLNGKLGNLAKEIAEETVKDLNINIDENTEPEQVFEKLFKNPNKLMNMASSVGKKLDSKIKSGNVKESE